jgi:drug/metabolite transporter (DMT)-like permease
MLHARGVIMLVGITLVWGTTFPLVKITTGFMTPAELIAARFLVATLPFLPWLRGGWPLWRDGLVLGVLLFAAFITQVVGLTTISSNRAAFITGLNVILVPIFAGLLLRRFVPASTYLAALMAFMGIGVMSLRGGLGGLGPGDAWVLMCAVTYALYVLVLERVTHRHAPMNLTAVQLFTVAALGLIWTAPELVRKGVPNLGPNGWWAVIYLGLMATALTTLVQAVAQRWVAAFETAVIYALEPVFAAVFSWWWLSERFGLREWFGAGLIVVAMLVSQLPVRTQGSRTRTQPQTPRETRMKW